MADGDYERGRGRELGAIAAELKRLAAAREGRNLLRPIREGRAPARPHEPAEIPRVRTGRPPVKNEDGWVHPTCFRAA